MEKHKKEASKDLRNMTRNELYEIAKEENIPGKSTMHKDELISAIENRHKGEKHESRKHGHKKSDDSSQPGHGGGKGDAPQPKGASPDEFKNIPGNQS